MDLLHFLNIGSWSEGQAALGVLVILTGAVGWLWTRSLAPFVNQIKDVTEQLTEISKSLVELSKGTTDLEKRVSIHDVQIKDIKEELKERN